MVNKDWLTPYNTGKVQIGCLYTPRFKPHPMTIDGLKLQRALLSKAQPKRSVVKKLLTAVNKLKEILK